MYVCRSPAAHRHKHSTSVLTKVALLPLLISITGSLHTTQTMIFQNLALVKKTLLIQDEEFFWFKYPLRGHSMTE